MHISEPTESYQPSEESIGFISSFQLYGAEAPKTLNRLPKATEQVSGKALLAPEHIFWPPGGTTSELKNQLEGHQRGGEYLPMPKGMWRDQFGSRVLTLKKWD